MLQIFLTSGQIEKEYTKYVTPGSIKITRAINAPSTCSITMQNADNNFELPVARSYIRIYSTKYEKNLYTGFLQNDPSSTFVGTGRLVPRTNCQIYSFAMNFTSDEYLLNIKSIPFLPSFVNQSQGAILRTLAESLCPGFYDFTYCASGDLVPFMAYDPSQTWSQVAKTLGDASRYRYSVINKEIHFQPYGDGDLGIKYDEDAGENSFDPRKLSTNAMTSPLVNDVTIVGAQEGGDNHEDLFIADGFTGTFPLRHKAFGLATAQNGGGILLADSWNGASLDTQVWQAQDPSTNFYYGMSGSSSLNVLTGLVQAPGSSFIAAQNGIELAGGVAMQHGEFVFNDVCLGIVGGVFDSEILNSYGNLTLDESKLEAGFKILPTANVTVTASGAAGISIVPTRLGATPSGAFNVVTKVNKSYVLNTNIVAPHATRYTQVYRSMAGVSFGAVAEPDVQGSITWAVTETDLFTGVQTFYTFTVANQTLPDTAIYVLIDNYQLNLTVTQTQITTPLPGSLNIKCKIGAGLLAPIYISGHVQYTGAFVTPSGGNLPILPEEFGPENNFALGTGLGRQAAELGSGQISDTLNFYSDSLPGVGARIRLQSFASQAAVSRLQDNASINREAAIVGDDGLRSKIVSTLSPLPRTAEDCDSAAQAYLSDSTGTRYQGTYSAAHSLYFTQQSDDIDFFPICGRYLFVNSPQRNIVKQEYLVTALTTTVTEMRDEIMVHEISFGADFQIEKLLRSFIPINANVLTPIDTSLAPDPITLSRLGSVYLPDVKQTSVSALISGDFIQIDLNDDIPPGAYYEIRSADLNWGIADSRLITRSFAKGPLILQRTSYEQIWYIRLVTVSSLGILSSRRSKSIRVVYPRVPSTPAISYAGSDRLQYDFTGDIRNIEGIKLSSGNGLTGFYEAIVGSQQDMNFNLQALNGTYPLASVSGNLGQHQLVTVPLTQRDFQAQFFNLMWEFSPSIYINIPQPNQPTIGLGYRFGQSVEIRITGGDTPPRTDIHYTHLQLANSPTFNSPTILIDTSSNGFVGKIVSNVPVTGDVWARAQLVDYISSGGWSNTVHVPLGDIIASDYMVGQGSVPPAVTSSAAGPGGIFTYTATNDTLFLASASIKILWPNNVYDDVPATSGTYTQPIDDSGRLLIYSMYGFFPSVKGPSTPTPTMQFNGPYAHYSANTAALTGMFQDGSVPMTAGAFVCQTSNTITGQSGGGGGGTGGGGSCGVLSSLITMADGSRKALSGLRCGEVVKNKIRGHSRVIRIEISQQLTYSTLTASGKKTRSSSSHTLYSDGWKPISELRDSWLAGEAVYIDTLDGLEKIERIAFPMSMHICKLELESIDGVDDDGVHVYLLDGIWTHNTMVKA